MNDDGFGPEDVRETMVAVLNGPQRFSPTLLPPDVFDRAAGEGIDLTGYERGADWPGDAPDLAPPRPRNRAERRAQARRR